MLGGDDFSHCLILWASRCAMTVVVIWHQRVDPYLPDTKNWTKLGDGNEDLKLDPLYYTEKLRMTYFFY